MMQYPDQALEEALAPRLRLAGDTGSLAKFGDFLSGRSLEKGTAIILFYRVEGVLEVALMPPGSSDYSQVRLLHASSWFLIPYVHDIRKACP